MKKQRETNVDKPWSCDHCGRGFARESTIKTHLCEQKRRWDDRNKPGNRIAFISWQLFYKQYQPHREEKTYSDFVVSNYWNGFVKYGNYCVDVDVLFPNVYVTWLLKSKIPLDNWTSDRVYTQYLVEYLLIENPIDAVHRSIKTMADIADQENIRITDVLRLYNSNKLCYLITKGKISPWLLYNIDSGRQFLSSLNQDQQYMIMDYINPDAWSIKIHKSSAEIAEIKDLLGKCGL